MIELESLTENDLAFFKNKRVVLWGPNLKRAIQMYKIFDFFGIKVIASCNSIKMRELNVFGIKTINQEQFLSLYHTSDDIVVQLINIVPDLLEKEKMLLKSLNVKTSDFSYGELAFSFSHYTIFKEFSNLLNYKICEFYWRHNYSSTEKAWFDFIKKDVKKPLFMALPPKTGDWTLFHTFVNFNSGAAYNEKIEFFNVWHRARIIDRKQCEDKYEKVRIIVGLREPISQNLSSLYQNLSNGNMCFDWMLGDLESKKLKERKVILSQYEKVFFENGQNVQCYWNEFIDRYVYSVDKKNAHHPLSIQEFISEIETSVCPLFNQPFNTEKGYAIIKDGNIEVFLYQLEKLNDLVPELSEWVGAPFTGLVRSNEASDKWVAASYKQAQKEIEITQEYFDKCFNEPYVKHCYSETDIERFKTRWRPHIKK